MYLGMDGGGTKTDYILLDETGRIAAHVRTETTHYMQIGLDRAVALMRRAIERACQRAGVGLEDIRCAFLGVPGFGENAEAAREMEEKIGSFLDSRFQCGNDVEAGWAGSLACRPGINLVCGTGAIGYGKDPNGLGARSSGWGCFCGDEGSAFWLGKKAIELFAKQSDWRLERTVLYELMKTRLQLKRDFDLIPFVHNELKLERDQVAQLALILFEAARRGDPQAQEAYRQAAYECSLIVQSLLKQLSFPPGVEVPVSYSGGVFKAGDLILTPLRAYLQGSRVVLKQPILSPVVGAALYAWLLGNPGRDYPTDLVARLQEQEAKGALAQPEIVA
ncbi:MAG TPA: BadF/BadG/BcrA/BcrD ATPase family protein [Limnochordia bacterium]|nr:BadF/BadG/BcrA/BcrD ATPase family protein [Limnochordia bacterium]